MMRSGWLRTLIFLSLLVCVHCKMIDLDCALFNPVHCQTLLESDDNTFGTIVLEPDLPEAIETQLQTFTYVPSDVTLVAQNSWTQNRPRTAPPTSLSRQRPPPWKQTLA